MEQKLTIKQNRFVKEYIKTGHATNSAIKAGYSEKTARFIASENLTKPNILAKIEKIMSKEAEKLGITAEYVLRNIKRIAENENEKVIPTKLKANELLGKHLKLFHDSELAISLEEKHQQEINQLEELE